MTDLDKANVLAKSFAHVSSNANYNDKFKDHKGKEEEKFSLLDAQNSMLDEPGIYYEWARGGH